MTVDPGARDAHNALDLRVEALLAEPVAGLGVRLLEARLGKPGKREYVQVLRLLETFRREEVRQAIQDALHLGTVSFDAVKHLLLCRIERRPPRLDLMQYPYLPLPQVHTTQVVDYMTLLNEVGS